jgi:hypothetical protein
MSDCRGCCFTLRQVPGIARNIPDVPFHGYPNVQTWKVKPHRVLVNPYHPPKELAARSRNGIQDVEELDGSQVQGDTWGAEVLHCVMSCCQDKAWENASC